MHPFESTTADPVSSHDVSIPNMIAGRLKLNQILSGILLIFFAKFTFSFNR